jgi:hypothetical protein
MQSLDEEELNKNRWRCPACNTNVNSNGVLLSGSRAVALHVSGKIRSRDNTHRQWALAIVGDVINNPYVKSSINTLADELEYQVIQENKKRLDAESKRARLMAEQLRVNDEPEIQAYRYIHRIEPALHNCVKCTLQMVYGEDENDWWVRGVPKSVREECAVTRERSPEREDLFSYTNLLDLSKVIQKNMEIFDTHFHLISQKIKNKTEFVERIERLNTIRNRIMHPVRASLNNGDLDYLRESWEIVRVFTQSG